MMAVALALVMVGVYARSADATSGPVILADLGGRPIPAVDVGRYQCEDFDFPRIHCYLLAADLEAAVARRLAVPAPASPGASATTLATNYVRVFADMSFGGVSAYLSVSYDDLSVIGWNDRISSFQGLAGNGGTFFERIYLTGAGLSVDRVPGRHLRGCCLQRHVQLGSSTVTRGQDARSARTGDRHAYERLERRW